MSSPKFQMLHATLYAFVPEVTEVSIVSDVSPILCGFQKKPGCGGPEDEGRSREQAGSNESILHGEGKCKEFQVEYPNLGYNTLS